VLPIFSNMPGNIFCSLRVGGDGCAAEMTSTIDDGANDAGKDIENN
jgi:hypothetical protein